MPFTAINDVKTESDDDTDAMTPRKRITTHESLSPITPTPSKRVASLDLNEVESPVKRTKGRLTPPPMLNAETPRQRSVSSTSLTLLLGSTLTFPGRLPRRS